VNKFESQLTLLNKLSYELADRMVATNTTETEAIRLIEVTSLLTKMEDTGKLLEELPSPFTEEELTSWLQVPKETVLNLEIEYVMSGDQKFPTEIVAYSKIEVDSYPTYLQDLLYLASREARFDYEQVLFLIIAQDISINELIELI